MQPKTDTDYKNLLTQVIQKQIVILGPDITLAKARNVKGLTITDDGTVTSINGPAQELIQALVDQFVQLSGLIVKKTMEPLLVGFPQTQPVAPVNPSPAATTMNAQQPIPVAQQPTVQTPPATPIENATPTNQNI